MTLMQKIAVWMAKRYLKAHHYCATGSLGFRVLAPGDALVTPNASRVIAIYNRAAARGLECEFSFQALENQQSFIGVDPPKIKVATVDNGNDSTL